MGADDEAATMTPLDENETSPCGYREREGRLLAAGRWLRRPLA
jgi:hypothetical protein